MAVRAISSDLVSCWLVADDAYQDHAHKSAIGKAFGDDAYALFPQAKKFRDEDVEKMLDFFRSLLRGSWHDTN